MIARHIQIGGLYKPFKYFSKQICMLLLKGFCIACVEIQQKRQDHLEEQQVHAQRHRVANEQTQNEIYKAAIVSSHKEHNPCVEGILMNVLVENERN